MTHAMVATNPRCSWILACCLVVLSAALGNYAAAAQGAPVAQAWSVPRASQALPPAQRIHVVLALALRHTADLDQLLAGQRRRGSPLWHQWLTASTFRQRYAPTPESARRVVDWLSLMGFSAVTVSPDRLLVSGVAPVPVIEAAFGIQLSRFLEGTTRVFANTVAATAPPALRNIVVAVVGLQRAVRMHPFLRVRPAMFEAMSTADQHALNPPDFRTAYDMPPLRSGSLPPSVAIFMAGSLVQVQNDFRRAQTQFVMQVLSPTIRRTGDPGATYTGTGSIQEWDLDSQSALGMAGRLRRMVWYDMPSLADTDVTQALSRWVNDPDAPTVASVSFGLCENDARADGSVAADDAILKEAAAMGRTLFASSGDEGDQCKPSLLGGLAPILGQAGVSYPASSPWVVAVGGTTLLTDGAAHRVGETAWSNSGGGVSGVESQPGWQNGKVPGSLCTNQRCVPDIAMDANPKTGVHIIVNGASGGNVYGGTSLSAPLAMAAWARIRSATNDGFAAPSLYGLSSSSGRAATGFHDISSGSNGSYTAGPGWDAVTGLGSFDVAKVQAALSSVPNAPSPPSPPTSGGSANASSGGGHSGGGSGGRSGGGSFGLVLLGLLVWCRRGSPYGNG